MSKNPTRNYAIEYVGGKRVDVAGIVSAAIIAAAEPTGDPLDEVTDGEELAHALDGPLHTEASDTTDLNATVDAHGLLPKASGDPNDALRGDLTWRPVRSPAYFSGSLSHPPTETELAAILGAPAGKEGQIFPVGDTGSGTFRYAAFSDGLLWCLIPIIRPVDDTGSPPAGFTVYSPAAAPEGGWSWFEDPRAIAYGAYTYVGYNQGGNLKIAVITAGAVVATVTMHTALEYDDHDVPTLIVGASSHKLIAFYSKHVGPVIYRRVSVASLDSDPTLASGFAAETTTTFNEISADRNFTYPSPLHTSDADGGGQNIIWLFTRVHVGGTAAQWHYSASTDDGATFPATTKLHSLVYSKVEVNGTGRIDVACSDHPVGGATKIGHLYRASATWHKSDGTTMGGSMPFAIGDMTTVYTASGSDLVWISDCAIDGSGNPVIVFARYPSGSTSDIRYMYALWTGSAWSVNEICAAGGYIPDSAIPGGVLEVYYHGGLSLDHDDPQIVYCSRETGGTWEVFKYVTADGGASFTPTQITTGSTSKQVRPVGVRNQADLAAVWMAGVYHNYVDYSVGIRALKP